MSPPKLPPPELDGFTYISGIEGGGFADVFLYEQHRPRRQVAIKVLRAAVTDEASRKQFEAEADHMAKVSHHPYIVTVYASDVAPAPDNRPYIVMEYYPPPHYGQRSRDNTMPVAEVLRVSVQVAAAVEFAHQSDILHRDIKPSNVLASAYGWPGLTDFGLASVQSETLEQAAGISIAYVPPEVAAEKSPGDVRGDVYSLAATVYALLAGRSPFERKDRNSYAELLNRIENEAPPPTGRTDVPASLELLLRQGLSKRPGDRPPSAIAFAWALRDIQHQENLAPTELKLEITDPEGGRRRVEMDDDPTARAPAKVFGAQGEQPESTAPMSPLIEAGPVDDITSQRPILVREPLVDPVERIGPREPDEAATILDRPQTPTESLRDKRPDDFKARRSRQRSSRAIWLFAAAVAALLVVVVGVLITSRHHTPKASSATSGGVSNIVVPPQTPTHPLVTPQPKGAVLVTWAAAPDATSETRYQVTFNQQQFTVDRTSYTILRPPKGVICVAISAELPGGVLSPPAKTNGCS